MASTITVPNRQIIGAYPQAICDALSDVATAAKTDIETLQAAGGALDWKNSVRVASAASIANLSSVTVANFDGTGQGITLVAGNRVLVKDNASINGVEATHAKRNWIYVVGTVAAGSAPLTRAADADTSAEVTSDSAVMVSEGTYAGQVFYISTADPITLDTTGITVTSFPGSIAITAPANVTKAAAAVGVGTTLARADHKHDVTTAAAGAIAIGDAAAEGAAASLARSDHVHSVASPAAPADVTKAAANAGAATTFARADHKHDISTAVPSDVTKAAAAEGTATSLARSDHKHDISTAAASGLTSASANAEGSATSLARSDHAHAITALNIASVGTAAAKSAGAFAATDFAIPEVLILTVPAGVTGDVDFTAAPYAFRVIDVYARKVTVSADAGDTGALQTGAGVAISSTLALNVAAGALVRTASIDPATHEIAAAGTLRWRRTQSTNADCVAHVTVVRVP